MNYWIITTEFPPFHGGGISTYNIHTALMFVEKGHNVTVFVPEHQLDEDVKTEVYKGINVVRFKPGGKSYYNYLGYSAALSFQFSEILIATIKKSGRPDFIETQDYQGIGYYLMMRKKTGEPLLQDIPIVLTTHAPSYYYLECNQAPVYDLPNFWTGEMEKWTMKAADICISPSNFLIDSLAKHLEEYHQKYHVLRYAYKVIKEKEIIIDFVKDDIVFFGKLIYQKGCLHLLQYLSELWDNGFEKSVSFIGDDHYFEPRQSRMKEFLIKKYKRHFDKGLFRFEGKLTPEQLNQRLSKAHLIIVPSVVDNFPFAVIESMLLGKVLLISTGGGQREMIEDGKSGFIYEHNNSQSFAQKINEALALSEEELRAMGDAARERMLSICNYQDVYEKKIEILNSYQKPGNNIFPFVHKIEKKLLHTPVTSEPGKLSIVIPYYNMGMYLAETVKSAHSVAYKNKEIIVINDGSDDAESISVLYKLQEEYKFQIVNQVNQGLAAARNKGVKSAVGEYIAFLDADDKVDELFYSKGIQLLQQYENISFVSSWVKYFDFSDAIWPAQTPEPPFMLLHHMINAGHVCRRADYLNFGINDSKFEYGLEDYDANLSLIENGCRGIVIPEPLYYYRIHENSMARGFNKLNQLYSYRILTEKHKSFYQRFAHETFNLLLANGPSYLYDNPTMMPHTDVLEQRKYIKDLEQANAWYQNIINQHAQDNNSAPSIQALSVLNTVDGHQNNYQYNELKMWYHKEYETLPLWFKRLGHIVKVFYGKRTVKSLFKQ